VGTKSYKAPEIVSGARAGYVGPPVDVWSMGIVLFSLVSGFFPLEEAKSSDWRYAKLASEQTKGVGACEAIYSTYKRQCPFTAPLRAMLNAMLSIDPAVRPTLEALKAHEWLNPPQRAPAGGAYSYEEDDYNDPVVYRGLELDEDEEMEAFEPPEMAMKIMRQAADRGALA